MDFTKENVEKAVKHFVDMYDGSRDFSEAYLKGVPYYYKRHHVCVVPTTIVNKYFGCAEFHMNEELVKLLKELGHKRTSRMLYKDGQPDCYIQCWVFNV